MGLLCSADLFHFGLCKYFFSLVQRLPPTQSMLPKTSLVIIVHFWVHFWQCFSPWSQRHLSPFANIENSLRIRVGPFLSECAYKRGFQGEPKAAPPAPTAPAAPAPPTAPVEGPKAGSNHSTNPSSALITLLAGGVSGHHSSGLPLELGKQQAFIMQVEVSVNHWQK